MPKEYWIGAYRRIYDPDKLARYVELAGPAITAGGGRFLSRNGAIEVHEAGVRERTIIVEFDSFATARAAYRSDLYQEVLAALGDGSERGVRIVEGVNSPWAKAQQKHFILAHHADARLATSISSCNQNNLGACGRISDVSQREMFRGRVRRSPWTETGDPHGQDSR